MEHMIPSFPQEELLLIVSLHSLERLWPFHMLFPNTMALYSDGK